MIEVGFPTFPEFANSVNQTKHKFYNIEINPNIITIFMNRI